MKIVQLTKYGRLAAATRQRFEQYDPFLQDAGLQVERWPLLHDAYLSSRYEGRRLAPVELLTAYLKRAAQLVSRRKADLLWVQYELFPYLPGLFERLAHLAGCPVVYDIDDAIFHGYDAHRQLIVRRLLGNKLEPLLRASQVAFCGNPYLAQYATRFGTQTEVIPTVVDTRSYVPVTQDSSLPEVVIGWIGTPSTWREYLQPMLPLLEEVGVSERARVVAVGASTEARSARAIDYRPWVEHEEIDMLQSFGIGIMPLTDTPWARGKCGYKLIQYMACGLPVVASPVGVNADIVEHGVNGFLVKTHAEWREALTTLLRDPALRLRMGCRRNKIERQYSLREWGRAWLAAWRASARSDDSLLGVSGAPLRLPSLFQYAFHI